MDRNPLEKFAALPVLDVALRKESVDRNLSIFIQMKLVLSRSPQGVRG